MRRRSLGWLALFRWLPARLAPCFFALAVFGGLAMAFIVVAASRLDSRKHICDQSFVSG
ncbi:putative exported protein of unknown function [Bradyrhizobium sp. BTAi1]|nr:putative exported protein of unknown function [Bradyrhizobium sp. BTAi1]